MSAEVGSKLLNFRCSPELIEAFRSHASENERTLSQELRHMMREAVEGSKEDVTSFTATPASPPTP